MMIRSSLFNAQRSFFFRFFLFIRAVALLLGLGASPFAGTEELLFTEGFPGVSLDLLGSLKELLEVVPA